MELADKVVLVTGAQQGIGRAMACEFAAAGADVAINWLDDEGAAPFAMPVSLAAVSTPACFLLATWRRCRRVTRSRR